jgi:hypothetical protein
MREGALMQELRLEDFLGQVGEAYQVGSGEDTVALTLVEAEALPPSVRAAGSFRLLFRGPPAPILPQSIYRFQRGAAAFDMFIVPIQPDAAGARYEAIFN